MRVAGGQRVDLAVIYPHGPSTGTVVDGHVGDALPIADAAGKVITQADVEVHVVGKAEEPAAALTVGIWVKHVVEDPLPVQLQASAAVLGQGGRGTDGVVVIQISDSDIAICNRAIVQFLFITEDDDVEAEAVGGRQRIGIRQKATPGVRHAKVFRQVGKGIYHNVVGDVLEHVEALDRHFSLADREIQWITQGVPGTEREGIDPEGVALVIRTGDKGLLCLLHHVRDGVILVNI